ncbi:MAG: ABC transporter substrate-binding protein [Anaerolineae bacterium]|nr:ABC transporter substrate-binding protein [Anaerolineae bacterium]
MENKGLSRRSFLKLVAGSTAAAFVASAEPLAALAQDVTYNEAPMLAELVAAGELPPVAERLPKNPRVIKPYKEIGEYGGTWHRAFKGISDRWGPTKCQEEMAIEWFAPDETTVELVPGFVAEWTQNDDATEFTFTLRDGLKWSDGAPFTTENVAFWYEWNYLGELENKHSFLTPDGVDMVLEVIDELSWKVSFHKPNPLLPISMAKSTGGPPGGPSMAVPSHYLKQFIPDHPDGNQDMIDAAIEANGVQVWQDLFGTAGDMQGPIAFWFKNPELPVINAWKAVNFPTDDPFVMERNPYYHAVDTEGNQLPYIDKMEHALFDDNTVLDLWIAQGRIDMQNRHVSSANFTFYKENEEAGDYQVVLWKNAATYAYHPNINHEKYGPLFDTPAFREALSIAINREEINDLIYDGLQEPRQASPVSGSPNFDPEFETRWTEYDPDKANELLDGIGLTERDGEGFRMWNGETISFNIMHRFPTGDPQADEAQLVENYWRAIGLKVGQDLVERSLYEERCENGDVEVGVWGVDRSSIVMADPGRYLGWVDDGPWAPLYGHWGDPSSVLKKVEPPDDHPIKEIWRLWSEVQAEPDEATRNALFQKIMDIHKEHPWQIGSVGEAPAIFIVSNRFGNMMPNFIVDDTLRGQGLIMPCQCYIKQA